MCHLVCFQSCGLADDLDRHCADTLAHTGSGGEHLDFSVPYPQVTAPHIGVPHTDSAVLHTGGDSRIGMGIIDFLYRLQGLRQGTVRCGDLSVGKRLSRTDGISVTDLPGGNANLLCQQVQIKLCGKAALGHAKPPVCACRNVVGVYTISDDLHILIIIRSCCMGTGALQYRASQRSVSSRIRIEHCFHTGQIPVFIAGSSEVHFHGMTLHMAHQALRP